MPSFHDSATTSAAPEEVWKILYDPTRFPEWWAGVEKVEPTDAAGDEHRYTMYQQGYPDFPIPQVLRATQSSGRIVVSCLYSDLQFDWRLDPVGTGTRISIDVDIPDREAHRLEGQRGVMAASLARLAALAAGGQ
jgi:uncharacterized protein YndB with AHSA1/START domain